VFRPQDIINLQISTHATFSLKNEFSKEKYKKRKRAKFAKEVAVLEPTLFNVAEYLFTKDPAKIWEMRIDTLAQLLMLGNVRPGARFLVVDETGGLLTAGVMERLGGEFLQGGE
jgi:tRNA (adenine-N(1)-)-methyltransferase non-catalytic subunit